MKLTIKVEFGECAKISTRELHIFIDLQIQPAADFDDGGSGERLFPSERFFHLGTQQTNLFLQKQFAFRHSCGDLNGMLRSKPRRAGFMSGHKERSGRQKTFPLEKVT